MADDATLPIRVRDARRAAERRQVVDRQRDLRSQDQHRLRQAADHAPPGDGRAHPPGAQLVFVDTPGLHKPVTALGERVNATALDSVDDVDVAVPRARRHEAVRQGRPLGRRPLDIANAIVIVNKIDVASDEPGAGDAHRGRARSAPRRTSRCRPCSGEGIDALVDHLTDRLPEGPKYFPDDEVSDHARGAVGGRAGPRATARGHPRRAAVLDRHPGHRVGVAAHPRRHHRRARQPEGHGDRQGRADPQAGRRAGSARSSPRASTSSCVSRSTRTGSAGPSASSASATDRSTSAPTSRRPVAAVVSSSSAGRSRRSPAAGRRRRRTTARRPRTADRCPSCTADRLRRRA